MKQYFQRHLKEAICVLVVDSVGTSLPSIATRAVAKVWNISLRSFLDNVRWSCGGGVCGREGAHEMFIRCRGRLPVRGSCAAAPKAGYCSGGGAVYGFWVGVVACLLQVEVATRADSL